MKEKWKKIEEYPNYMISNFGRVKSLNYNRTGKERILKQQINNSGYCYVRLCKDGKNKHYLAHRLVAQAFIPNYNNLPQVNHKNEVKTDNCVDNLEWVTNKQNSNYGTRNERCAKAISIALKGKKHSQEHIEKCAKAHQIPIVQLLLNGDFIKKWDSATQASKELGINNRHISTCCKGKYKTAKGYKWKYLQDYINEQIQYLNELKRYRDRLYNILKEVS